MTMLLLLDQFINNDFIKIIGTCFRFLQVFSDCCNVWLFLFYLSFSTTYNTKDFKLVTMGISLP